MRGGMEKKALFGLVACAAALVGCETTGGGSSQRTQALVQGFVDAVLLRCIPSVQNGVPVQDAGPANLPEVSLLPRRDPRQTKPANVYQVSETGGNVTVENVTAENETSNTCSVVGAGISIPIIDAALVPGLTQITYDFEPLGLNSLPFVTIRSFRKEDGDVVYTIFVSVDRMRGVDIATVNVRKVIPDSEG